MASSLELRAEVVDGHFLQVLLVPHGSVPIVTTGRMTLGCYLEIDVVDTSGNRIGHIGPMASCPPPRFSEFRAFRPDDPREPGGADVVGARFDLLAAERVRVGPHEQGLLPGQEYRFVARYHADDASILSERQKGILRGRYGAFWSGDIELESAPVIFRYTK